MVASSLYYGCTSARNRPRKNHSLELQNFLLRLRRARRVCRPHLVIVARLLIVLFTAIELKPVVGHLEHDLWPFLSRLNVLVGFMASVFAVIFFDMRIFNFVVVATTVVDFMLEMCCYRRYSISHLLAWVTFHSTAVLFSTFVGRRRSIAQPQILKSMNKDGYYVANLRALRNVDILEAGIRLQASLLAIDYSLSSKAGGTGFMFTLPFAGLFLAGYSTRRNGLIVLLLLLVFSVTNKTSPILGFDFIQSASTVTAASLSIAVGPGVLAVDEYIATKKQLCY